MLTLAARLLLIVFAAAALAAAACAADNPNVNVESNEYFRPPPPERVEPITAQTDEGEEAADDEAPAEADDEPAGGDAAVEEAADQGAQAEGEDAAAPAPRAEDIVRRYRNPVYGYSFELVCPPFCDPTSNGVDEVGFRADGLQAIVAASVLTPPADEEGDVAERLIRETLNVPDTVDLTAGRTVRRSANGVDAVVFEWEEDNRAVGGIQVRWKGWIAPIGGLYYIVRGGAAVADWDAIAEAVERMLNTFTAPIEAISEPGTYNRFGFEVAYDAAEFRPAEYGQPTTNPATDAAGAFVLANSNSVIAVLAWEEIGAAFFDAEIAIERTLQDLLGIELGTGAREADEIDGQMAQTTITLTALGADQVQIASWAWYCPQGGREFALHYIDIEDPRGAAAELIESFRCSTGGGG